MDEATSHLDLDNEKSERSHILVENDPRYHCSSAIDDFIGRSGNYIATWKYNGVIV